VLLVFVKLFSFFIILVGCSAMFLPQPLSRLESFPVSSSVGKRGCPVLSSRLDTQIPAEHLAVMTWVKCCDASKTKSAGHWSKLAAALESVKTFHRRESTEIILRRASFASQTQSVLASGKCPVSVCPGAEPVTSGVDG
jgi:hypothetical protein